ncbi:hypothetical protein QBC38DRAFT_455889 [Podospora fimiseda]|uniref:Uncharacterized protein n=1 Tax=Podospora fimiseda TaxID=252190 RepID=A0AAN7BP32_9PEZI|nr:hypothetical protein QBC38DRAFT_455889 [Podospora fimiseda]
MGWDPKVLECMSFEASLMYTSKRDTGSTSQPSHDQEVYDWHFDGSSNGQDRQENQHHPGPNDPLPARIFSSRLERYWPGSVVDQTFEQSLNRTSEKAVDQTSEQGTESEVQGVEDVDMTAPGSPDGLNSLFI